MDSRICFFLILRHNWAQCKISMLYRFQTGQKCSWLSDVTFVCLHPKVFHRSAAQASAGGPDRGGGAKVKGYLWFQRGVPCDWRGLWEPVWYLHPIPCKWWGVGLSHPLALPHPSSRADTLSQSKQGQLVHLGFKVLHVSLPYLIQPWWHFIK